MTEIQERARFDFIRYANCWEDADILLEALRIKPGNRCLSVASSGDNSLSMLVCDPEQVVAADLSRVQIACLELRIAAFKRLSYQRLLEFLGIIPFKGRSHIYHAVKGELSDSSRQFFKRHMDMIEQGVIYPGKFEQYFKLFRTKMMPLIHSHRHIDELLADKSIQEQEHFYHDTWDNQRFRILFHVFFSKFTMGRLGRDTEFFRYAKGTLASRLLTRVEHALTQIPNHTNPYLNFILTGSFPLHALPHYLREENFEAIKRNISRIKPFLGTVSEAIEAEPEIRFDTFNMSDIFEYMDMDLYSTVLGDIESHATSGARLAFWNMMVDRELPETAAFTCNRELSETLFLKDKAFFYKRFLVGEKT